MAILRSRGGRWFTTCPPMRISPSVGGSNPAIMRSKVVLPQPEGPKRTRNSPSLVDRSTPSTAQTSPKHFFRPWTSTVAIKPSALFQPVFPRNRPRRRDGDRAAADSIPLFLNPVDLYNLVLDEPPIFPLGPDALALLLGLLDGILGALVTRGGFRKHRVDDPGAEHLVNGRVRVARVSDVCGPVQDVFQNLVLGGRLRIRIIGDQLLQIRNGVREARKVVKLAGQEPLAEIADVVHQELLGAVDVLRS